VHVENYNYNESARMWKVALTSSILSYLLLLYPNPTGRPMDSVWLRLIQFLEILLVGLYWWRTLGDGQRPPLCCNSWREGCLVVHGRQESVVHFCTGKFRVVYGFVSRSPGGVVSMSYLTCRQQSARSILRLQGTWREGRAWVSQPCDR